MSDTKSNAPQPFLTRAQQLEKLPPCEARCPNSGDIRGWLGIIAQHEKNGLSLEESYDQAWRKIAELNPFPATMGRICPHPCEDRCTRRDKDGSVSIKAMERFLGDWGISRKLPLPKVTEDRHVESIGVIGSGPASLSFAYQMARRGYPVTIYDKHEAPGGMLRHAIPNYRLPEDVLDAEVQRVLSLDICLIPNVDVGTDIRFEDLRGKHNMIFLGVGAQAPKSLGIPGESGPGVIAGIAYLEQRKHHVETFRNKRVIVIGGGNTAIDAARMARRDGAEVTVLYRRTEEEMPADRDEIQDAHTEGIRFRCLAMPTRIVRDEERLRAIEFQPMRPGPIDAQGRHQPVPVIDRVESLPAEAIIVAVSQEPDMHGLETLADAHAWLRTEQDGKLADNIWAGGDDRGPGIASQAIAQGRLAAEAAHAQLREQPAPEQVLVRKPVRPGEVRSDYFADQRRASIPRRSQDGWLTNPELEIEQTIDDEQARTEAARCMSCGMCFDCEQCFMYCNAGGFTRIEASSPGKYFVLALDACEGCGKCIELCPCGYLESRDGTIW